MTQTEIDQLKSLLIKLEDEIGKLYRDKLEQGFRKTFPHSESHVVTASGALVHDFLHIAVIACGQQIHMASSVVTAFEQLLAAEQRIQ